MNAEKPTPINIIIKRDLSYTDGLALQQQILHQLRNEPTAIETLLLVEHQPVITLGRQAKTQNLLLSESELAARKIALAHTNRGGDITYHGTGQWTIYPLLRLRNFCPDLHRYMFLLEAMMIAYLRTHDLHGARNDLNTGVWLGKNKICAVGIACSAWISWHGCAINIQPNLRHFTETIVPCGLSPNIAGVTSIANVTKKNYSMDEESQKIIDAFFQTFNHYERYQC